MFGIQSITRFAQLQFETADELRDARLAPTVLPPPPPPAPPDPWRFAPIPFHWAHLTAPPPRYTGEPSVEPTWLAARETALVAVHADVDAARAQALASAGSGPGWIAASEVEKVSISVTCPS